MGDTKTLTHLIYENCMKQSQLFTIVAQTWMAVGAGTSSGICFINGLLFAVIAIWLVRKGA